MPVSFWPAKYSYEQRSDWEIIYVFLEMKDMGTVINIAFLFSTLYNCIWAQSIIDHFYYKVRLDLSYPLLVKVICKLLFTAEV